MSSTRQKLMEATSLDDSFKIGDREFSTAVYGLVSVTECEGVIENYEQWIYQVSVDALDFDTDQEMRVAQYDLIDGLTRIGMPALWTLHGTMTFTAKRDGKSGRFTSLYDEWRDIHEVEATTRSLQLVFLEDAHNGVFGAGQYSMEPMVGFGRYAGHPLLPQLYDYMNATPGADEPSDEVVALAAKVGWL